MIGNESYPVGVALLERETYEQVEQWDWRPCTSQYHHEDPWHTGEAYYEVRILHPCSSSYNQIVDRCKASVDFYHAAEARNALCLMCLQPIRKTGMYEIVRVIGTDEA